MALILSGDTGPSIVSASALPAGSVLQVVSATNNTPVTVSSSTYVSTGLTRSITPASASNKVLVLAQVSINFGSQNNMQVAYRISRSGTIVYTSNLVNNVAAQVNLSGPVGITYLDSPATTSSVTYTIEFSLVGAASGTNNPQAQYNYGGYSFGAAVSSIVLQEIAG